ncbi:hypothetical protein C8J33_10310 [Rhizobium sp. PP-CC-3G-465]|nr:hypothetical protein C8J33_10310 [Rhizobium sp. PP-CC-3G-465]
MHLHDVAGLDFDHGDVAISRLRGRQSSKALRLRLASARFAKRGAVVQATATCVYVMATGAGSDTKPLYADRNTYSALREVEAERTG